MCILKACMIKIILISHIRAIKSRAVMDDLSESTSLNEEEERETSLDDNREAESSFNNNVPSESHHPDDLDTINEEDKEQEESSSLIPESRALNGINHSSSNGGVPGQPQSRPRRKSSYVLSIVPGRRHSATLQYVKVHRSLLNMINKKNNSNFSGKKIELDTVRSRDDEDEVTNGEDTSQLLMADTSHVRICSKAWWAKRVRNTKTSFIKSMKNLKLLIR